MVLPLTVPCVAAIPGVVPACCWAHWRHSNSSAWNCSKALPCAGIAAMLGPGGTLAQPLTSTAIESNAMAFRVTEPPLFVTVVSPWKPTPFDGGRRSFICCASEIHAVDRQAL
jgi:hypothetical protein